MMKRISSTHMAIAILAIAFFSFASSLVAQTNPQAAIEVDGRTMGPIKYRATIADFPASVSAEQLQTSVQSTLDRVNQRMSTYIPDSDVSRFNNSESTDWISVDAETALVVARAIEISEQTNGAFDITVGPVVNLWNFGPNKKKFAPPTAEEIDSIKNLIGYQKLSVKLNPPMLRKTIPGLRIDLSAIAKGYAVDAVAEALAALDCTAYLVEVGGEVRALGAKSDGSPWRIGVEYPTTQKNVPTGRLAAKAALVNRAMATSGDYRNFEVFEGQRYSHTIDPATCRPVAHTLATACIVADDCMTADALATAVSVLGAKQGSAVCEKLGVEFFLMERDEANPLNFNSTISTGFPAMDESEVKQSVETPENGESIWPAFIAAAVVFGLAILAMAVGSIFANKPVTGSCGGLANMTNEDGEEACGVCAKPTTDCIERDPVL